MWLAGDSLYHGSRSKRKLLLNKIASFVDQYRLTEGWYQSLFLMLVPCTYSLNSLGEALTTITEDKVDFFVVLWEHQQMLWDPSDPNCKNKKEKKRIYTSSSFMVLYIHRNHKAYWGLGTQDGHHSFLKVPELLAHISLCIYIYFTYLCQDHTSELWR